MNELLFVRIKSNLQPEELERRILDRKPKFLEVPGLVQKIYGRDPENGDICGVYFFKDKQSLNGYRESELARSITDAYEAEDVRRESFEIIFSLRPESGD